mgnify:CR=1 FL=1
MTIKIDKIIIKHMIDTNPDTSFLGEYTDTLQPGVIVRDLGEFYEKLPAPMERDIDGKFIGKGEPDNLPSRGREYRGFIPYAGGEKQGTKNYYRYGIQDFKRITELEKGYFSFIGIAAEAVVKYPVFGDSFRLETLSSAGLWGIESDSGDYLKEVKRDELASLKKHLETFGVDVSDFDEKAAQAETREV